MARTPQAAAKRLSAIAEKLARDEVRIEEMRNERDDLIEELVTDHGWDYGAVGKVLEVTPQRIYAMRNRRANHVLARV